METKSVYITVRLDIESNEPFDDEGSLDFVQNSCRCEFQSERNDIRIEGAEICGINE